MLKRRHYCKWFIQFTRDLDKLRNQHNKDSTQYTDLFKGTVSINMKDYKYPRYILFVIGCIQVQPDGRSCCTANAVLGSINDKKHGGQVGILKTDDGKPGQFKC